MHKRGFTLIELLVVIAIIGILSAVVLASLNAARGRARDSERVSGLTQMRTAIELYYNDNGVYPQSCHGTATWGGDSYGTACPTDYIEGLAPTYIPQLPQHPGSSGSFIYRTDAAQANYKLLITGVENHNPSSALDDPGYSNCASDRPSTYAVYTDAARCW